MDFIDSVEKINVIINYLVPGFITYVVVRKTLPPYICSRTEQIVWYILYSGIVINIAALIKKVLPNAWCYNVTDFIVNSIVAILLGFVITWGVQKKFLEKILDVLDLNYLETEPTAWDYIFSKQESSHVVVKLDDGSIIEGQYDSNSFASSIWDKRDIYIDRLEKQIIDGQEYNFEGKQGIYINSGLIRTIQIIKEEENA